MKRQVERLYQLKLQGQSPTDKRGKRVHGAPNKLSVETKQLVFDHINSYTVKEAHYYSKNVFFLDKELNLEKMYNNFKLRYPNISLSRSYYTEIYRTHYMLRFGKPQIDTCCFCEEMEIHLQSKSVTERERAALIISKAVHKKSAEKFFIKLREIASLSKSREDVLGFSIDYMMNLCLPLIPVQESFYLSKLTVNVFSIKNFKTGENLFFM